MKAWPLFLYLGIGIWMGVFSLINPGPDPAEAFLSGTLIAGAIVLLNAIRKGEL